MLTILMVQRKKKKNFHKFKGDLANRVYYRMLTFAFAYKRVLLHVLVQEDKIEFRAILTSFAKTSAVSFLIWVTMSCCFCWVEVPT